MSRNNSAIEGIFDGDSDLGTYFHEIENSGGVSEETERELSERIKLGDEQAMQELVQINLRFVVGTAKQYKNRGLPLADLVQAGNLGLITAAKRFDGKRGFKFISYAVWWVKQGILQALAEGSRTVRLPTNKIGDLYKLNKLEVGLVQRLGRVPTPEEIVSGSDIKNTNALEDLRRISQKDISLNMELDDDTHVTLQDNIVDTAQSIDEEIEDRHKREVLLKAIEECLDTRESYILVRYFGLDGELPWTLQEIARNGHLKLTRERVRQIKEKALAKLRAYLGRNNLRVIF